MIAILVYHVIEYRVGVWLVVAGLVVGAVIGVLLGRINRVSWDRSTGTVVTEMDLLGGMLLVIYLGFTFSRGRIIGAWIDDAHTASAIALALGAGSISGRILYLLRGIRNTLTVARLLPCRDGAGPGH